MESVQKSRQSKNETTDKDTKDTILTIAYEHGMSYREAEIQYRRMQTLY